jgi:hypothetical protein
MWGEWGEERKKRGEKRKRGEKISPFYLLSF